MAKFKGLLGMPRKVNHVISLITDMYIVHPLGTHMIRVALRLPLADHIVYMEWVESKCVKKFELELT